MSAQDKTFRQRDEDEAMSTDEAVQARLEEIDGRPPHTTPLYDGRKVYGQRLEPCVEDIRWLCQQVRTLLARVAAKDGQLQKDAVRIAMAEVQRDTARQQLAAAQERIVALRGALEGTAVRRLGNDGTYCWCTLLEPDGEGGVRHGSTCSGRRATVTPLPL